MSEKHGVGLIRSDLREERVFQPSEHFQKSAQISSLDEYQALYRLSIEAPERFWAEQAERNLQFFKPWERVLSYTPARIGSSPEPYLRFFEGAELNASYNCLDRHVNGGRRDKVAIHWQGEKESETRSITYGELYEEVCRCASALRALGVKRGSAVTIFLPMIPEVVVAILACARIGAIHSVVFSAFSQDALRSRIQDCGSTVVITADGGVHGGKTVPLKERVDRALDECPTVRQVLVVQRTKELVRMQEGRDKWWHEVVPHASPMCDAESMDAEAPLFILYTSGSTGKPKGVLHTTAGYLLYAHLTFRYIFDIQEQDIFWCTADVGWITGHSYLVYGPLSNGATCVMFEGVPTYPEPDRFWRIIERYRVTIFYTAPTAIRALMRLGEEWPNRSDLSSLRLIGSVGEPINPEAWMWYHRVIGQSRCPVVDTWWQTETGGIMITTLPGAHATKPGCAGLPFFGVLPEVLKDDGSTAAVNEGGGLFLKQPWPGMLRGVFGDAKSELVRQVYFSRDPERYFTGDGCRVDEDGYYWLLGRIDDVINVSAHRFATAEIESALVSHPGVAEAAVVGVPHEVKGQGIYCFVTVKHGVHPTEELRSALVTHVRTEISPIATPDRIHFAPALPKTRSGKIMRRILRKIAESHTAQTSLSVEEQLFAFGDISTLADPSVVESLLRAPS